METKAMSMCRVLLRVRMLYYLKAEVLGEAASQALEEVSARYGVCQSTFSYKNNKCLFCFLILYYFYNMFFMFGSKLEVALPEVDYMEIPSGWWDAEADKSLLIGVHKHGRVKLLKH